MRGPCGFGPVGFPACQPGLPRDARRLSAARLSPMTSSLWLSLLAAAAVGTPVSPAGQTPAAPPGSEALQVLVGTARHPDLRWPDFTDVQPELSRLYGARNWSPLWFAGDSLTQPALALVRVLREAANRGLDPADYDAEWLSAQPARPDRADSALDARVELGLSIAAARFALALRFGRVSREAVHATFRLPADSFDLPRTLEQLAQSPEPNGVLRTLEPPFVHYWILMASLVRYRELARDSDLLALPPMPDRLRPGDFYDGVLNLRRLLKVLGDYRDSLPPPTFELLYTGEVVEAVKRFQIRQGFKPDGVIGDSTRARLSHPFEQRIRQMELTLERWRWMPRKFTRPPILVNIPAFRLYAFRTLDLDERTMLAMNVVVGTAFKTETPVFADELEYLTFSPYWDVTPAIASKEIKPAALRNPEFLTRNRYELVELGEPVAPWLENIARIGQGVRVRQLPGAHNALGLVKFIMPNDFQVYLHDTPSKATFERTRRDASHGCIRLGDPFGLATFLLRDQPEWTEDRIRTAMNAGEPTTVRLRAPVPVYITYATAVARTNGEVYFYNDLYRHDLTLDRLLRQGYPYPRPGSRPRISVPVANP
jgi:murein L,D-transpeptidase YcbB/YkuD